MDVVTLHILAMAFFRLPSERCFGFQPIKTKTVCHQDRSCRSKNECTVLFLILFDTFQFSDDTVVINMYSNCRLFSIIKCYGDCCFPKKKKKMNKCIIVIHCQLNVTENH